MARINRPALMIYGGTIKPGIRDGQKIDIISAFQSYGEYITGNINEDTRHDIIKKSCPGAGACGGMYTANTMASAIEALGLSLPYSSSTPAVDPRKLQECFDAGAAILNLLELDLKPRDILTRESFENAMVLVTILGGSTNAVLHLLAMARAADINLTIDDFQSVTDRTPFLADLKPSGKYVMEDLHNIGGIPAIMKYLLENDFINGECMTVTGKTISENLADVPGMHDGQDLIHSLNDPIKKSGHIRILKGNLAPGGSVAKITGKEGEIFTGTAKVFDSEEDMLKALEDKHIEKGDVVVIRYEGPKGGPGMPEMLTPTSAIMGAGLGNDVAMITDGRFSGGSHGFIIGHVVPEAQEGGPIALIRSGDKITIDASKNLINVNLSEEEFSNRKAEWKMPPYKASRGTLHKYIKNVKSASEGCVTDE
jgi:dihydroxy-acid dehydratase